MKSNKALMIFIVTITFIAIMTLATISAITAANRERIYTAHNIELVQTACDESRYSNLQSTRVTCELAQKATNMEYICRQHSGPDVCWVEQK